jgi:hypothetical protein
MPPMLDIAFLELATGTKQQMFANQMGSYMNYSHHIL